MRRRAHALPASEYTGDVKMGIIGFPRTFIVAFVLPGVAVAQSSEDALRSKIAVVHYPPLAEAARIQGDVRLNVKSGMVTLVAGHPLLAQTAIENAKGFAPMQGEMNLEVTYHFVIDTPSTTMPTSVTVKRGDAFERAVLRMFGLKTEKTTVEYRCEERVPPPNDLKVSGAIIEVWIHGRIRCIETEAETLTAKR